jgi:hypothetical protein
MIRVVTCNLSLHSTAVLDQKYYLRSVKLCQQHHDGNCVEDCQSNESAACRLAGPDLRDIGGYFAIDLLMISELSHNCRYIAAAGLGSNQLFLVYLYYF